MRVLIAGNKGLVGSGLERNLVLAANGWEVLGLNRTTVDFCDEVRTYEVLRDIKPDWLVVCAAKVGGIKANSLNPVDFLRENLKIQDSLISGAYKAGIRQIIFLGSSCIYPKFCEQPIKEEYLLSGSLEKTNEAYAVAKISGIKMCEFYNQQYGTDYRCLMPTNLYGPNDNFDPNEGHVIPGLISRLVRSKQNQDSCFKIWGSGSAQRDFLHVDDLARAIELVMKTEKEIFWSAVGKGCSHLNVGSGTELSILNLSSILAGLIGFDGVLATDLSLPDGTPRKILDISKICSLGWSPQVELAQGLAGVVASYLSGVEARRP